MLKATVAYQYIKRSLPKNACDLTLNIVNQDSLVVAQSIKATYGSVCVLNMANQFDVGGDYLTSCALSQEESLIQRTNLLDSLIQLDGVVEGTICNAYKYALPDCLGFSNQHQKSGFGEFTCLYSSGISVTHLDTVARSPIDPFVINVISSAAYNLAFFDEAPSPELYLVGTVLKIINQLRTAKANDQRHLVLAAFGCGAFNNAPETIAGIYNSVIHAFEFQGCFDVISFAIKDSHSNNNYDAFSNAMNGISYEPLYDLLRPAFDVQAAQPILPGILVPFITIDSQEELVFLTSGLIKRELNWLEKSRTISPKLLFLRALLDQIVANPESAQDLLESVISSEKITRLYPMPVFFKVKPAFLLKLEGLLSRVTIEPSNKAVLK